MNQDHLTLYNVRGNTIVSLLSNPITIMSGASRWDTDFCPPVIGLCSPGLVVLDPARTMRCSVCREQTVELLLLNLVNLRLEPLTGQSLQNRDATQL